jgi:hypothetical protein
LYGNGQEIGTRWKSNISKKIKIGEGQKKKKTAKIGLKIYKHAAHEIIYL